MIRTDNGILRYWNAHWKCLAKIMRSEQEKLTVVSEVFHLTPDTNLSTLRGGHSWVRAKGTESKNQKNYNNKFVHSQLITRLKSETWTKKTQLILSEWNVALRPFSQLTTWKLHTSNRFHSFYHVLWVCFALSAIAFARTPAFSVQKFLISWKA